PSPVSADKVASLYLAKQKYDEAIKYYTEAANGDSDNETKATYYYKLGLVTRMLKDYCRSIDNIKEAIKLNPNYGEAYLLLGDNYIDSRTNLDDQLGGKTAYWAAVDKYKKAKEVDPELSADANKKINDYSGFFPISEDCFFLNLEEGKSYQVRGCINEYTVIKYRN
ncbi:tetratricopeptide repeat protein, partial [Bacteroidota bacterium]